MVGHRIHIADHDQHFKINEMELSRSFKDVSITHIRVRILLWILFQIHAVGECVLCVSTKLFS